MRKPLPHPRYRQDAPSRWGLDPRDPYFPPNGATIGAAAQSPEVVSFVLGVLRKLNPDEENTRELLFYEFGTAKFGRYWRSADILTTLRAAAVLVKPNSYLEIGVRRGRSAAVVAATSPQCAITGFDLWIPDYAGADNPGPDLVRSELQAVGHEGNLVLIKGPSSATVPSYLADNPDLFFDIITVDGDHSVTGAALDLANVLPRLKVGGVLVFDDVRVAPLLQRVWERLVRKDGRFSTWECLDSEYGVAAAVRLSH